MRIFLVTVIAGLMMGWFGESKAQQFDWAPDFPVGSQLPMLDAPDQHGVRHSLPDLSGEKGLVLILSRSFDWCPYCITQLKQLVEIAPEFAALGFSVATMTYDSEEILQDAQLDYDTVFALLRDEAEKHVTALGILNSAYQPGSRAYGIPYPGILLISPSGKILAKFAEEDYRDRPDFQYVLDAARQL